MNLRPVYGGKSRSQRLPVQVDHLPDSAYAPACIGRSFEEAHRQELFWATTLAAATKRAVQSIDSLDEKSPLRILHVKPAGASRDYIVSGTAKVKWPSP